MILNNNEIRNKINSNEIILNNNEIRNNGLLWILYIISMI